MGHAVAAGVSHLVFARLLLNLLELECNSRLNVMLLCLVVEHEFHASHGCVKIVSGMFHVGSHAEVLAGLRLCEPVLSLNVVGLLFASLECRAYERELRFLSEVASDAQRAEECAEEVFLFAVEIHLERLDILHRSEVCLSVFWLEVVVVVRDVPDEVDGPSLIWLVTQICLVVYECRVVFSLCLERAEQILVGFVSHAVAP